MSPFSDALANWPNSDLLLRSEDRERVRDFDDRLLTVLDWPALRNSFEKYDAAAKAAKRNSRLQGVSSVLLTGFGIIILTISIDLSSAPKLLASEIALAAMLLGGALALLHWLGVLRSRQSWLLNRLRCERLRQLQFQSMIAELDLTCSAYESNEALAQLRTRRAHWLNLFESDFAEAELQLRAIVLDKAEKKCWIHSEWAEGAKNNQVCNPIILDALYRSRLGVQWTYAHKNLGVDVHSARGREILSNIIIGSVAVMIIGFSGLGLYSAIAGSNPFGLGMDNWVQIAAIASAVALMMQTLKQGLQTKADTDRYESYGEKVEALRVRYDNADISGKVHALRALEEEAYREMRNFLFAHSRATFVS